MDEAPANTPESVEPADTRHEPHTHARPRLIWGITAVVVVAVGILVWLRWGDEIKAACTGEDACTVEIADVSSDGAAFAASADF